MHTLAYKKVDAFTEGTSLGNPAACFFLERGHGLTPEDMLRLAVLHKGIATEIVFCEKGPEGYALRYFAATGEIAFCGHATVACMYSLITGTPELAAVPEIPFLAGKARLTAYNRVADRNAVYIAAPEPVYMGGTAGAAELAAAFGVPAHLVGSGELPVAVIEAGLKTLLVPMATARAVVSIVPDAEALRAVCAKAGAEIVLPFSLEAENPAHFAHSRVFPPFFGYAEDPATGSGNSALGYYLRRHGLWAEGDISIEQGGPDFEFNAVRLAMHGGRLLFGGSATVRVSGVHYL